MTVYQVWDFDPMASNWGDDYCAETFASKEDAERDAARRNEEWRQDWIKRVGADRENETTNWKRASVRAVPLR